MVLTKAWDLAALKQELLAKGLPDVENLAEKVSAVAFDFTKQSLVLEGGLVGGVGLTLLAAAEPMVKNFVDKIDGQPG